jgi:hypothetical protein
MLTEGGAGGEGGKGEPARGEEGVRPVERAQALGLVHRGWTRRRIS